MRQYNYFVNSKVTQDNAEWMINFTEGSHTSLKVLESTWIFLS